MTVNQLLNDMTREEFVEWGAYFKLEAEEMQEHRIEQQASSLAQKNYHR